jgi:predicted ester cyclase
MSATTSQHVRELREQVVLKHLEAENRHDIEGIMETFSQQPGFALNGAELSGQETVRAVYEGFGFGQGGSFSDIQIDIKRWYWGDESVTVEMFLNARHTGEWQGIAATGNRVAVPLCAVFTFDEANKVASERAWFDGALVLQQLGVLS